VGHSARFGAIDADLLCRAVVDAGREITRRVAAGAPSDG